MNYFSPSAKGISTLRSVSQQSSMPTNEEIFTCFEVIGDMGDIVAYHKLLTEDNIPDYEVFVLSGDQSFQPMHHSEKSLELAVLATLRAYIRHSKKV